MAITQESLLSVLLKEGGKIRNSELISMFQTQLNSADPAEKKQNRDVFKTCINNIAVVNEIEQVKYVVLKKKHQHLLDLQSDMDPQNYVTGINQRSAESGTATEMVEPEAPQDSETTSVEDPEPSFVQVALQRHNSMNFKARKSMQFKVPLLKLNTEAGPAPQFGIKCETGKQKPVALPLRVPVVITSPPQIQNEIKPTTQPTSDNSIHLGPVSAVLEHQISPRLKRRSHTDITEITPQVRREYRSAKPVDESKDGETPELDSVEHAWMVTSAVGHWSLVYGYLLKDAHLAVKRDFISGFTALHWAAKCGNSDMLCKIIDKSRENSKGMDVNTKSFAGYTPLHIAAIHHQEYIIRILVKEYGANCHIRDNSGKKAHHYLHNGISLEIRELLGEPKAVRPELKKHSEDGDTQKHSHSISRLFQPQTVGYKKKPKTRSNFLTIAEDSRDEQDEHGSVIHRVRSDIFA